MWTVLKANDMKQTNKIEAYREIDTSALGHFFRKSMIHVTDLKETSLAECPTSGPNIFGCASVTSKVQSSVEGHV